MYKLVVIGGKLRGKEFPLGEGENGLGRDPSNKVIIQVDGVSKFHLKITINGDAAYIEDLGSSNGTFINGKLEKSKSLKNSDKIALPNVIFQLVYVQEKKKIVKKIVTKAPDSKDDDLVEEIPPVPESPIRKILHIFKYKLMPVAYTFNREYEWRVLVAILLAIFIAITIFLTIYPVLLDSRNILLSEIGKRGFNYAEQIAEKNATFLSRKNLDSVDTKFLDNESGVESYELFDTEGRIVRPLTRLNEYTNEPFSIEAKNQLVTKEDKDGRSGRYIADLRDGKFGIAKSIKTYNVKTGLEEIVGIIAIKFAPTSLVQEAANNSKAYLESLTTSALVGIIFFAMVYYLTIRHFDDIRFQIDQVIRGKQKEIVPSFIMTELSPLVSTMNSVLQKYMESINSSAGMNTDEIEEDTKYINTLREFLLGANGPAIVLNSEKKIQNINVMAEDLTGIRESAGVGQSLLDVSRDQGFAATLIDLCDQSASAEGVSQKGNYELAGTNYSIFVTSLIGKDKFAKAFYITFLKD